MNFQALISVLTSILGAIVGRIDPMDLKGKAIDQRIKGTLGITG